jgi:hypothetical protein
MHGDTTKWSVGLGVVQTQMHRPLVFNGHPQLELLLAVLDGHRLLRIGLFETVAFRWREVVTELRLLAGVESDAALHDDGVALFNPR